MCYNSEKSVTHGRYGITVPEASFIFMQKGFIGVIGLILGGLVVSALAGAAVFSSLEGRMDTQISQNLGAVNYVAAKPTKLGGSGVAATDTTINLVDLETPAGTAITMSNFGEVGYGTIEPGKTRKEFISFTGVTQNGDGTATLTGVTRGLNFVSPYTASTTLRQPHAGGSVFVISNPPQLYDASVSKYTDSFVTSTITFSSFSIPRLNGSYTYTSGDELKLVTYGQLASTSFSGTVDSSLTQKGLVEQATIAEAASTTLTGGTTAPLTLTTALTTSTPGSTQVIPVTKTNGNLDQGWLDLTEGFTFSGGVTSTATTTVSGRLTTTNNVALNSTTTVSGTLDLTNATVSSTLFYATTTATGGVSGSLSCNGTQVGATSTIKTDGTQRVMITGGGGYYLTTGGSQVSTITFQVYLDGASVGSQSGSLNASSIYGAGSGFFIPYVSSVLSNATHTVSMSLVNAGLSGCESIQYQLNLSAVTIRTN